MRLDAAVFRAERVGGARLRLAETLADQFAGVDALRGEISDDRVGASLRQAEIILLRPGGVGMPVDLEALSLQARVMERLGELVEIFLGGGRQLVRVEFERHQQVELRRSVRRRLRTIGGGSEADRLRFA